MTGLKATLLGHYDDSLQSSTTLPSPALRTTRLENLGIERMTLHATRLQSNSKLTFFTPACCALSAISDLRVEPL